MMDKVLFVCVCVCVFLPLLKYFRTKLNFQVERKQMIILISIIHPFCARANLHVRDSNYPHSD